MNETALKVRLRIIAIEKAVHELPDEMSEVLAELNAWMRKSL